MFFFFNRETGGVAGMVVFMIMLYRLSLPASKS